MGIYVKTLDERLQATDQSQYYRNQYQSSMTGPEWRNVEMAEEFAGFLREGNSMFQFPFFRQTLELWKVLYRSFASARKSDGILTIIFSEYMLMDLFVTVFTMLEFIPKGIVSLLFYPFLKTNNSTSMQTYLADYAETYARNLQTIPFYDHDYKKIQEELAQKYKESPDRTLIDRVSWACLSTELRIKRLISRPLSYWYHQETTEVPSTTDMIVRLNVEKIDDPEKAKQLFQACLKDSPCNDVVHVVDGHIYVKPNKDDKLYTSVYARLRAPRYKAFPGVVQALAEKGIHIKKIAGQNHVQIKCVVEGEDEIKLKKYQQQLQKVKDITPLYTYSDHIHPGRRTCLFNAPVHNLDQTLERINKLDPEHVHVEFIHNF